MKPASMNQISPVIQQLQLTLLPGNYNHSGDVPPLYNAVYGYWKKTWSAFFEKAGSGPNALNIENFMRSRYVIVIHRDLEVVATLSASVFNPGAATTFDHPSVKEFPEFVLRQLSQIEPKAWITGEYLSVGRDYKKELVGVSLADVLVGLLLKIMNTESLSAMLATPVRAAKVADISYNYGCKEVGSYMKIGVDCQMVYVTRAMYHDHPSKDVTDTVNALWNKRTDMTKETIQKRISEIRAA